METETRFSLLSATRDLEDQKSEPQPSHKEKNKKTRRRKQTRSGLGINTHRPMPMRSIARIPYQRDPKLVSTE